MPGDDVLGAETLGIEGLGIQVVDRRLATSLFMADAADSLTLGPTAARLATRAAISGRSKLMGPTGAPRSMMAPPPGPGTMVIGTPD